MTWLEAAGLVGSTVATFVLLLVLIVAFDYVLRQVLRRLP